MDSWKYLSEGRGEWLSEELDFTVDGQGRCKSKGMGCENYPLVSNSQALERMDMMDLGFSDDIRKSYSISSEPSGEVFSDEMGTDSYGNGVSPFCEDKELGSRMSTDFVQSSNQEFNLIDLNLGRNLTKDSVPAMSNNVSSPSGKRVRSATLCPRPPCCQVLGCNKDLSSYKGYYKRHKVCDVHTKTSTVIVDGIEQRFCQQCSRFHLLIEFDDGKRSCRRRLAAHNKRRRKPQLTSETGSGMIGFSSSYGFQDMLPNSFIDQGEGMSSVRASVEESIVGIQNESSIQQNTCALSLLSAQSHNNMSSQLLGATINNGSHADSSNSTVSFKRTPQSGAQLAPEIYSDVGPTMINNPSSAGPSTYNRPLGRGIMLDLLQLSSNLQRVEQQRLSTESEAG